MTLWERLHVYGLGTSNADLRTYSAAATEHLARLRKLVDDGQPVSRATHGMPPMAAAAYRERYAWLTGGSPVHFDVTPVDEARRLSGRSPVSTGMVARPPWTDTWFEARIVDGVWGRLVYGPRAQIAQQLERGGQLPPAATHLAAGWFGLGSHSTLVYDPRRNVIRDIGRHKVPSYCGDLMIAYDTDGHALEASVSTTEEGLGQLVADLILFAFALAHCKNIAVAVEPATSSRRARKATRRALPAIPPVRFRTLVITPTGSRHGTGTGQQTKLTAHHLCRGHFKTYTAERPLLGRAVGTYWWSAQWRGNRAAGRIEKTYSLGGDTPS